MRTADRFGLDALDATSGDPVALIGVLDCAAKQQVSPVGGLFDMLQGLKIADQLGLSWYDDAIEWITQSSYFDDLTGHFIGTSHAWGKHGHKYGGAINTKEEFVDLIETIIQDPDNIRFFRTDTQKKAFWDDATGTIVIFDPTNPDLGTAFPPDDGYQFFLDL